MSDFKVFINFKTYPQGTGKRAVELARICEEVSKESKVSKVSKELEIQIIPIVQTSDVFRIKQEVDIPVWVQHLDWQEQGQYTGWQNLEAVINAGASGTLLNHSEHQIPPGMVKQVVSRIENCKLSPPLAGSRPVAGKIENFETMICCKTLGQMKRLIKLKPDYIGYEIGQLIGGKTSIVEYDPEAIKHAVEICGKTALIAGAGINSAKDLKAVKDLGGGGVLISSAVVLAENPKEKLMELIKFM